MDSIQISTVRLMSPMQTKHGHLSGTLTDQFYTMYYEPQYHWVRIHRNDWKPGEWECIFSCHLSSVSPITLPPEPKTFKLPGKKHRDDANII